MRPPASTVLLHVWVECLVQEGECFGAAAALDTHKALVHIFFAQRSTKKIRGKHVTKRFGCLCFEKLFLSIWRLEGVHMFSVRVLCLLQA